MRDRGRNVKTPIVTSSDVGRVGAFGPYRKWRAPEARPGLFPFLRQRLRVAMPFMRRPSKTELEFGLVAFCMALPAAYWVVRTVFRLIG